MWNTEPRHLAVRAHKNGVVTSLLFDGERIITASDSGKINVHDVQSGAPLRNLEGHEGGVWAIQQYQNTLVSASTDRSIRVWDLEKGECTHIFRGHKSTVRTLKILPPTQVDQDTTHEADTVHDWPLIISGSRDSTLRIWKLPQAEDPTYLPSADTQGEDCPYLLRVLEGHQHSVRAMAAHGDTLVSGSYDCTVRVWKISTGALLHTLDGHGYKVYAVAIDQKRNRVISGSMDHTVRIWSLETGAPLFTLEGHTSLVGILELKEDIIVSASADSVLRVWDPENGECRSVLSGHSGAVTCFQHDNEKVVSGSDRGVKMWNIQTGVLEKDLLTELSGVWQVCFRGQHCVAAVQRDSVTFIEILDFDPSLEAVPSEQRGKRMLVDESGL